MAIHRSSAVVSVKAKPGRCLGRRGSLPQAALAVQAQFETIGHRTDTRTSTFLADAGYHAETTLAQRAAEGIEAIVADTPFRSRDPRFAEAFRHKPQEKRRVPGERRAQWFQKTDFTYDPEQHTCRCPNGQWLKCTVAAIKAKAGALAPFYGGLRAQGKAPMQAIVAVMRKLVHIAFVVLKHQTAFNPQMLAKNA